MESADGRLRRSARSRDAVVDAILTLLREDNLRPAAAEIAERAGVSPRSVFRHFEDLEALFRAAADRQAERILPYLEPLPTSGPFARRLDAFLERRVALYEDITPVRRAALGHAPFHAAIRDRLDRLHTALRRQTRAVFAAELGNHPPTTTEALDMVSSWAAWETLRRDQRLSIARARKVTAATISAILGGDPPNEGTSIR